MLTIITMVALYILLAFSYPGECIVERDIMVGEQRRAVFETMLHVEQWNDLEVIQSISEGLSRGDSVVFFSYIDPMTMLKIHGRVMVQDAGDSSHIVWQNKARIPLFMRLMNDKIAEKMTPLMDATLSETKKFLEAKK